MIITINADGGARGNPGPAAAAFVAKDEAGILLEKRGKYLGRATNNVAEYSAVVLGLDWVLSNLGNLRDLSQIQFFLDSNLVVNQLNGKFKVKDNRLRELFFKIKSLEQEIGVPISYSYVPREKNFEADELVNETLDRFTYND